MKSNEVVLFESKNIRRIWHEEQWYYSVVDIIEVLSDSPNPRVYWGVLKNREPQLFTNCKQLKMIATDGKTRQTDAAHTEGVLRLIMSVPSPKAEPFKLWLAEQGKRSLDEMEDPELGFERLNTLYKIKGYSDEWIAQRLKSIGIRRDLTDEWKKRGVKEHPEYALLTTEIAKATFGLTPAEHKRFKQLEKENLRDHMTNMELIFTMLGEETTRTIAMDTNAEGFDANQQAAFRGGRATGIARQNVEKETGKPVVSDQNFLQQIQESEGKKSLPPPQKTLFSSTETPD